jgi:pre-mRNA-splicing factor SYF2
LESNEQEFQRKKDLEYSIQDTLDWNEKQNSDRKDVGFSDYNQINKKKYEKLIHDFEPNMELYKQNQQEPLLHEPSLKDKIRLQQLVEQDRLKRASFSRRRKHDEEEQVDYINERNARFNKKVNRAYDKYTSDIKANFERGTAL